MTIEVTVAGTRQREGWLLMRYVIRLSLVRLCKLRPISRALQLVNVGLLVAAKRLLVFVGLPRALGKGHSRQRQRENTHRDKQGSHQEHRLTNVSLHDVPPSAQVLYRI